MSHRHYSLLVTLERSCTRVWIAQNRINWNKYKHIFFLSHYLYQMSKNIECPITCPNSIHTNGFDLKTIWHILCKSTLIFFAIMLLCVCLQIHTVIRNIGPIWPLSIPSVLPLLKSCNYIITKVCIDIGVHCSCPIIFTLHKDLHCFDREWVNSCKFRVTTDLMRRKIRSS